MMEHFEPIKEDTDLIFCRLMGHISMGDILISGYLDFGKPKQPHGVCCATCGGLIPGKNNLKRLESVGLDGKYLWHV